MAETTKEYDLKASGGLMETIQALLAPPCDPSTSAKEKEQKHPYYRRPGKGHNRDCCDACLEGGDLICCDICPASFHLECFDPPLEEKDIPQGEWLCHTCLCNEAKNKEEKEKAEKTNDENNVTENTSDIKTLPIVKCLPSRLGTDDFMKDAEDDVNINVTPSPTLNILVKAACVLNPLQFELPKAITPSINFPGMDKVDTRKNATKRSSQRGNGKGRNNKSHELLSDGLVPLPARTCFECGRSCRTAALISCDYCPLLFHQDCLDPPLTVPPTGRWMCPNHVETHVDSKFPGPFRTSERVRLWNKYTGPIDQHAIKTEFIRKVRRKDPPFRIKRKLPHQNRLRVPSVVSYSYKNPAELFPSLRDLKRVETLLKRVDVDEAQNKKTGILDQVDILTSEKLQVLQKKSNDEGSNASETKNEADVSVEINANNENTDKSCTATVPAPDNKPVGVIKTLVNNVNSMTNADEVNKLDERVIRNLALQRLQQLKNDGTDTLNGPTPNEQTTNVDNMFSKEDIDRIARVLIDANKKDQAKSITNTDIWSNIDNINNNLAVNNLLTMTNRTNDTKEASVAQTSVSQIRARAVLYPLYNMDPLSGADIDDRIRQITSMRYRSLSIGRGASNQINLDLFGQCIKTSAKHAEIFYDEATRHYELINYSMHGTYVNNVLYVSDYTVSKRSSDQAKSESSTKENTLLKNPISSDLSKTVREICETRRRKVKKMAADQQEEMSSVSSTFQCSCNAKRIKLSNASDNVHNWDGTAILSHGAIVRFGCLSFMFSITDDNLT